MPWPADEVPVPARAAAARTISAIFDQTVLSRHALHAPSPARGCRGRQSGRRSLAPNGANSYWATQTHPTPPQTHLPRARHQSSQTAPHPPPRQILSSRHPRSLAAWTSSLRGSPTRIPGGGLPVTRPGNSQVYPMHSTRALPETRKLTKSARPGRTQGAKIKVGDARLVVEGHRLGGSKPRRVTAQYAKVVGGPVVQSADGRASPNL